MKIQVHMQDADALYIATSDLPEDQQESVEDFVISWGGEYITIEYDTELGTATLIKPEKEG